MLQEFVSGRSFDDYVSDRVLPFAVERQFEIFGEAARKAAPVWRGL